MTNPALAALLAERYGPPPTAERSARPAPHPDHGDGGADTQLAQARRRRELCEALDDAPQAYRRGRRAA